MKKKMEIKKERQYTFVGLRPMVVDSKKKKALKRSRLKAALKKELREY